MGKKQDVPIPNQLLVGPRQSGIVGFASGNRIAYTFLLHIVDLFGFNRRGQPIA